MICNGARPVGNGARSIYNGARSIYNGARAVGNGARAVGNGVLVIGNGVRAICDGAPMICNGAASISYGAGRQANDVIRGFNVVSVPRNRVSPWGNTLSRSDNAVRWRGGAGGRRLAADSNRDAPMPQGTYDSGELWDTPGLVWLDVPPVFAPLQHKRIMNERALKLHEKDLPEKVLLCIDLEQGLSSTTHVPAPKHTPATLAAKRAAIATQQGDVANAQSNLTAEQNALDVLEAELSVLLEESAADSEAVVSSDRIKMAELNIPLRKIGTPSTEVPPVPANVRGSYGDLNGEIDWMWDAVGRDVVYFGELAPSAAGPWTQFYAGKRSRCTAKNLVSGQEYFFRVSVERNDLRSNPSELANHRAT